MPTSPTPPVDLSDLKIVLAEQIGEGGFSVVWSGYSDTKRHIELAVKFLKIEKYGNRRTLIHEMQLEFGAVDECRRAFIVPILDVYELQGRPGSERYPFALVMRCHRPSLHQLLQDLTATGRRLSPERAEGFAHNLLDALAALHHRGIIHRDIKPGNILIEIPSQHPYNRDRPLPECHALLSDFGTVATPKYPQPDPLEQDGYKAPELFEIDPATGVSRPRHGRPAHPADDLYSLGRVLAEIAAVVEGPADWLLRVADDLMHPDPARRPPARAMSLRDRLSPDWDERQKTVGGWNPRAHAHFSGREFVFEAFAGWAAQCATARDQARGGYFVVEADAGLGKTALTTEWVRRGSHPAYFFRLNERTNPAAMAYALFLSLCRRFRWERDTRPLEEEYPGRWAELLYAIRPKLDLNDPLLLIVDGLDEADNPEKAVELLPRPPLPPGLFVVITSRPRIVGRDHLAALRANPTAARFLAISGDSPDNIQDLARFLFERLSARVTQEQAAKLAAGLGGTFQLGMYVLDDIQSGDTSVEQALTDTGRLVHLTRQDKVSTWYQQTWDRIKQQVPDRRDQAALVDFLCLLAAAQSALGERTHVMPLLKWRLTDLDWAKRLVRWLIREREDATYGISEALLQIGHKSVYDFITSRHGPARYGLNETHARIGRFYLKAAARRGWSAIDQYGRSFVVKHLCLSGDPRLLTRAADLLENLDFLQATLTRPISPP